MCSPKQMGGMGFRDFRLFNKAMLAKQGWRLIQHPTSLLGRIFKAKYFPNCSFLEAKVPNHSSFIWRSIASARDLISKGSRWRMGDERSISIWQDNWVPRPGSGRIISPRSVLPENARVNDLLSPLGWNKELVEEIFLPFQAEIIFQIPLSRRERNDKLFWHGTKTGIFSVESAYNLLVEEVQNANSGPSFSARWISFWKNLWSVKVAPKIKNFMWCACSNILPLCSKLFERKIGSIYSCPICFEDAETISHIFMECEVARECWNKHNSFTQLLSQPMAGFVDLVEEVMDKCDSPEIEIFFTTTWFIWRHRNEIWSGSSNPNSQLISSRAAKYALEYIEAVTN